MLSPNTHRKRARRAGALMLSLCLAFAGAACRSIPAPRGTQRDRALARSFNAAFALVVEGRHAEALEILSALENELQPADSLTVHVLYWSGHCHQELGHLEEAARYYRKVISDHPESKYARWAPQKLAELARPGPPPVETNPAPPNPPPAE